MKELAADVALYNRNKEKSQPKTLNPESRETFTTDQVFLPSKPLLVIKSINSREELANGQYLIISNKYYNCFSTMMVYEEFAMSPKSN